MLRRPASSLVATMPFTTRRIHLRSSTHRAARPNQRHFAMQQVLHTLGRKVCAMHAPRVAPARTCAGERVSVPIGRYRLGLPHSLIKIRVVLQISPLTLAHHPHAHPHAHPHPHTGQAPASSGGASFPEAERIRFGDTRTPQQIALELQQVAPRRAPPSHARLHAHAHAGTRSSMDMGVRYGKPVDAHSVAGTCKGVVPTPMGREGV